MPRVTTYDETVTREILERLSAGTPLAEICRDEGMPHPTTFRRWVEAEQQIDGETLAIAYARAREDGFDRIAMDALHIADDNGRDTRFIKQGEDEREAPDHDWISRAKLRVETRLKLLAKWDPKRYGDKQLVGSDPDNPLPAGVTVSFKG